MIYFKLFYEFFLIGLFTFGGGYAMIPLIRDAVLKHGWMNEETFLNMIGLSEMTPGPIAINMATFVGSTTCSSFGFFGKLLGSFVATIAVVLPAFIIMLLIAIVLKKIIKNRFVQGALKGISPVAISLIATTAITIVFDVIFPYSLDGKLTVEFNKYSIAIILFLSAICFTSKKLFNKKISSILIIVISGILGLALNYLG